MRKENAFHNFRMRRRKAKHAIPAMRGVA